jgi:hypothetical protein
VARHCAESFFAGKLHITAKIKWPFVQSIMMSDIAPLPQYNTKAQTFIAKRGALVMKEFSPIGVVHGRHASKIEVDSLVFTTMKAAKIDRTYGIKLTVYTTRQGYEREETCLIDQDELTELIKGMNYLSEKLVQFGSGVPSYTELIYVTNDDFKVGFFVSAGADPDPTLFCSARGGENAFMPSARLSQLTQLVEKGMEYLSSISEPSE